MYKTSLPFEGLTSNINSASPQFKLLSKIFTKCMFGPCRGFYGPHLSTVVKLIQFCNIFNTRMKFEMFHSEGKWVKDFDEHSFPKGVLTLSYSSLERVLMSLKEFAWPRTTNASNKMLLTFLAWPLFVLTLHYRGLLSGRRSQSLAVRSTRFITLDTAHLL